MEESTDPTGFDMMAAILRKLLPFIIIVVAVLIFFNRMAFSNLILARGDTFLYFYPYWNSAADALTSGRLPLWNTDLFMGAPFLANSQAGFFYPLNWPFWLTLSTPYAVSGSIILHIFIAGWGAYLAGRRCLSLSRASAVLSAILFALGGYLTAQIEHVNQLQGLAWLPWYFVAACQWRSSVEDRRATARFIAAIAILTALQLLAGHTQTVFISLVGLAVWILSSAYQNGEWHFRRTAGVLLVLLSGAVLAILLAGAQVAPTAELLMNSSRQSGFSPREALSFSLHPLIVASSLLPQYDTSLFTEYIAFLPLSALLLAIAGAWSWRQNRQIRALFFISAVGFLFALGMFNPIYQLLVRIPGFDLFRVPARWLALYAFGAALLAGAGLELLTSSERQKGIERTLAVGMFVIIGVMGWGLLSGFLATFIKVGAEVTVEYPNSLTWVAWAAELALVILVLAIISKANKRLAYMATYIIVLVGLFAMSRSLPYNDLTTPEAFFDFRPPSTRLQANAECLVEESKCDLPGGRILSLSDIFFDPGDQDEIDSAYGDLLPKSAQYDYTIAIKQKEIIAPDLSMLYGLQSVDGFDGGVLPLADYIELMALILPEDKVAVDGRLREYLDASPEARWMDLFNARYLITDKVGDEWRDGVFFDNQHPIALDSDKPAIEVGFIPDFSSTELWLISDTDTGIVEVTYARGEQEQLYPEHIGDDLYRVQWSVPGVVESVTLMACEFALSDASRCNTRWSVDAATLVDSQEGVFMPITMGKYRLVHSGDVKIYENLDVTPRAFLVNQWIEQPDVESSIEFMADPFFDHEKSATVIGLSGGSTSTGGLSSIEFVEYEPEIIKLSVASDDGGFLVLTDAYYPGWEAFIGGERTEIYQTDGYFRGLPVPPGRHIVEFRFEPQSLSVGLAMTALGIFLLLVLIFLGLRKKDGRSEKASK